MNAYFAYLNGLINKHKIDYSAYSEIKWLNPYEAVYYQEKRDAMLASFKEKALFKDTKPFFNGISTGCKLCGHGLWSCLFITSKCNATCFYCPTAQNTNDLPETQGLTFETAESYAEYVKYFKFKGVAFSGGEPLLAVDKILAYTSELRKTCDPDLYIWMYTNGILASEKIFALLSEVGINEVRFDIGATDYKLDAIAKARRYIQNITIEIPAVPGKTEQIKKLLPLMVEVGVTNINLHQMRLTPYNVKKLIKHNYTYIAAEQPIVLESELAALELMNFAKVNSIPIGINYCSFFFKNQFQKAGYRRIVGKSLCSADSEITEKGFIRKRYSDGVAYEAIVLKEKGKLNGAYKTLELGRKSYDYQQSTILKLNIIENEFKALITANSNTIPTTKRAFDIWMHEYIESGLREY